MNNIFNLIIKLVQLTELYLYIYEENKKRKKLQK